jgi:hypothetical protein
MGQFQVPQNRCAWIGKIDRTGPNTNVSLFSGRLARECGCLQSLIVHEVAHRMECGANEGCAFRAHREVIDMLIAILFSVTLAAAPVLDIDVDKSVVARESDLILLITLRQPTDRCQPVMLDPMFAPIAFGARPNGKLTVVIRDSDGVEVPPLSISPPQVTSANAARMILLDCDGIYGVRIMPWHSSSLWRYDLAPGQYTAFATLNVPVGRYASKHPAFFNELVKIYRRTPATVASWLRDFTVQSDSVTFTVTGAQAPAPPHVK